MKKLCIIKKRSINSGRYDNIIAADTGFVKEKCGSKMLPQLPDSLLFAEGLAVGALICSRIDLMGTHQNLIQGTVVLVTAVMGALLDGALDALVCMTVHNKSLL